MGQGFSDEVLYVYALFRSVPPCVAKTCAARPVFVKVARLQSEFCTKDFFQATNFLTKNAPKFSPKFLSLCSVGQKNPAKFPPNFPLNFPNFPAKNQKKIHRRASAGAQGEVFAPV